MRELDIRDFELVYGGMDANACQSAILGAATPGATAGTLLAGSIGSVIPLAGTALGMAIGGAIGALAAGGYTAANNPNCTDDGDQ